jgi:hypothetical protein
LRRSDLGRLRQEAESGEEGQGESKTAHVLIVTRIWHGRVCANYKILPLPEILWRSSTLLFGGAGGFACRAS